MSEEYRIPTYVRPDLPKLDPNFKAPEDWAKPLGTMAGSLVSGIGGVASKPLIPFLNVAAKSPLAASLLTAAVSGGLGYGLGAYKDWSNGYRGKSNKRRYATIGALLGGLGSYLPADYVYRNVPKTAGLRQAFCKSSFFMDPGVELELRNKISQAQTLSYMERQFLSDAVSNLSTSQQSDLLRLLGGVGGGAIGFVIAKYLLNLGVTGQVLLTLLGALQGGSSNSLADSRTRAYSYR
jgi:hypothetical protein